MRLTALITLSILLILSCGLTQAGTHSVTVDRIDGYFNGLFGPMLNESAPVRYYIRVSSSGEPSCRFEPNMGFRVYSDDGASWVTTTLSAAWYRIDTLDGGTTVDTVFFDENFSDAVIDNYGVTGSGADTVGFNASLADYSYPGIANDFNEISLTIDIIPMQSEGRHICLDIVQQMPEYIWEWTGEGLDGENPCGTSHVIPDWGGPYCYEVGLACEQWPVFTGDCPLIIEGDHCETMSAQFRADDPCTSGPGTDDMIYSIVSGPGEIDSLTGLWTMEAGSMDYIGTHTLDLQARISGGTRTAEFSCQVTRTNQAPMFTAGCGQSIVISTSYVSQVEFAATDNCPEDVLEFLVVDDGGAIGPVWFEGNVLNIQPDYYDWGIIDIMVGVTDGDKQDICPISFQAICSECGGCCGDYTDGYTGNVDYSEDGLITLGDITALIDHVYISKNPLMCPENGNVNGSMDGMITLGDITALIDHVYVSKQPTAECP